MNQKRGVALILAAIFLVLYGGIDTYISANSVGLNTELLALVVAPILCVIGFILAMLKD